jgi:hypothetical protein
MKNLDLRNADRKPVDETGGLRIQGVAPDQLFRRM